MCVVILDSLLQGGGGAAQGHAMQGGDFWPAMSGAAPGTGAGQDPKQVCFGFQVQGSGFRVSGVGFRVLLPYFPNQQMRNSFRVVTVFLLADAERILTVLLLADAGRGARARGRHPATPRGHRWYQSDIYI